jgi:hypothetical protein
LKGVAGSSIMGVREIENGSQHMCLSKSELSFAETVSMHPHEFMDEGE